MDHYWNRKQALQEQLDDRERECGRMRGMLEAAQLAKEETENRIVDLRKEIEATKVRMCLALSLWDVADQGRKEVMT